MKKRKWSLSRTERKLDRLWADAVKKRDNWTCRRCGHQERRHLQAAHIHSRSRKSTRHDLANGVCLCAGCHLYWAHKHPVEFVEWVREFILPADVYQKLRLKANKPRQLTPVVAEQIEKELNEVYRA